MAGPQMPLRVVANHSCLTEGDYAFTWVTPTTYVVGLVAKLYDNGDVTLIGLGDEGHRWRTASTRCTKLHVPQAQDDLR